MEDKKTLEGSMKGLEEIINKMESPDVSLEESFNLYKEGVVMLKNCNEMIDNIEKEITILEES